MSNVTNINLMVEASDKNVNFLMLGQAPSICFLKTKIKQCVWALVLGVYDIFNTSDSLIHLYDVTFKY